MYVRNIGYVAKYAWFFREETCCDYGKCGVFGATDCDFSLECVLALDCESWHMLEVVSVEVS